MKILVFGNIGSGKSTVIHSFMKSFPFEVIAIDDFRRRYSDGKKSGELIARQEFFKAIKQNKNQFIECIGVGEVADELFLLLQSFPETVICLTVITPIEICKQRLEGRVWDIPFPKPIENVFSLLERSEIKISNKEIENKWSSRHNTVLLEKENISPSDIEIIVSDLMKVMKRKK